MKRGGCFWESPQRKSFFEKPCRRIREKRVLWPPPGLTLKKQKTGQKTFFYNENHGGGGCYRWCWCCHHASVTRSLLYIVEFRTPTHRSFFCSRSYFRAILVNLDVKESDSK